MARENVKSNQLQSAALSSNYLTKQCKNKQRRVRAETHLKATTMTRYMKEFSECIVIHDDFKTNPHT